MGKFASQIVLVLAPPLIWFSIWECGIKAVIKWRPILWIEFLRHKTADGSWFFLQPWRHSIQAFREDFFIGTLWLYMAATWMTWSGFKSNWSISRSRLLIRTRKMEEAYFHISPGGTSCYLRQKLLKYKFFWMDKVQFVASEWSKASEHSIKNQSQFVVHWRFYPQIVHWQFYLLIPNSSLPHYIQLMAIGLEI